MTRDSSPPLAPCSIGRAGARVVGEEPNSTSSAVAAQSCLVCSPDTETTSWACGIASADSSP